MPHNPAPNTFSQMPKGIWVLGFVSMLMDISSEMIHSVLPMFMVTVLGASALTVGLIEGAAVATALTAKVFAGALSDYIRQRKAWVVAGYTLGALAKPLVALAQTSGLILGAHVLDRVGKGVRGAPRDAMVADIAPPQVRGAAFGLRQSLNAMGSLFGPLLAVVLMLWFANDFRVVFWVAVIPGVLAVVLLVGGVKEPSRTQAQRRANPIRREDVKRLGPAYWWIVAIGTMFTLARFSEVFLILKAQQTGVAMAIVPLVMVAMSLVYATTAYPVSRIANRLSHNRLLALGCLVLVNAHLVLASASGWFSLLLGVGLWGIHLGLTQGLLATLVANAAPPDLRGTAFGLFNLGSGFSMLVGCGLAGGLWDFLGSSAAFYGGALFGLLALVLVVLRFTHFDHLD